MTTVFPKVRAKTAGAGLSPHGKTNNMLSCEMAFDAFPEGKGAQQTSHWGWNHGGKYCSIIINSFFFFFVTGAGRLGGILLFSPQQNKYRGSFSLTEAGLLSYTPVEWSAFWLTGTLAGWMRGRLIGCLFDHTFDRELCNLADWLVLAKSFKKKM